MKTSHQIFALLLLLTLPFISTSCKKETKPKNLHGEIIGTTAGRSDSVILILLHPETVLDTIKIQNGKFHYKYPSPNYSRVKMTKKDSTYQKGWCKDSDYRIVKMQLIRKGGRKYDILFLNRYYEKPQYFDPVILDNSRIIISIADKKEYGFIKATVDSSRLTNQLYKNSYDFFTRVSKKQPGK